jgi:putative hemolysin
MSMPRGALTPSLDATLDELLDARWRAGRTARGLSASAPFAFDRPESIGADELEEPLDAAIYRRARYAVCYDTDARAWPAVARDRFRHALEEIEALRAELRLGPLAKRADS